LGCAGVGCDRAARDHVALPAQSSVIMISRFDAFVATLLLVTVAFGPRNTRKDAKNFSQRSTAYLSVTFVVDFLSCTSCVSWAKRV
jgi:hypothetical protein